jgi:hypothetical protein
MGRAETRMQAEQSIELSNQVVGKFNNTLIGGKWHTQVLSVVRILPAMPRVPDLSAVARRREIPTASFIDRNSVRPQAAFL